MADIISFRVQNYKSYKDEVEFTFEAMDEDANTQLNMLSNMHIAKHKGKTYRLLNSAVIYGANASGKSNIVWAFYNFWFYIKKSMQFDPTENIMDYSPFRFSDNTCKKPTQMAIQLLVKGKLYEYGYAYDESSFSNEILVRDGEILFSRNKSGAVTVNKEVLKTLDNKRVNKNQLALSNFAIVSTDAIIQTVFKSLSDIYVFPLWNNKLLNDYTLLRNAIIHSTDYKDKLLRLLKEADISLNDLKISKDLSKRVEIKTTHIVQNKKYELDLIKDESLGTNLFIGVALACLVVLEKGGCLVYDEMNIALHPELVKMLVDLFNNPRTNPNDAQLLFTTHDTTILNSNIMRADQVWFAQKDPKKLVSDLFSVKNFRGVSIRQPFESMYRMGRFGAVPCTSNNGFIYFGNNGKK